MAREQLSKWTQVVAVDLFALFSRILAYFTASWATSPLMSCLFLCSLDCPGGLVDAPFCRECAEELDVVGRMQKT